MWQRLKVNLYQLLSEILGKGIVTYAMQFTFTQFYFIFIFFLHLKDLKH